MFRVSKALYLLPMVVALTAGQSCSYFAPSHANDGKRPSGPGLGKQEAAEPPAAADAAAVVPVKAVAPAPVSDAELPMYGGKVQSFKDRKVPYNTVKAREMSRDALSLGWTALLQQKDTKTAMLRFNQAWVTDPDNFEIYWGFGMVCNVKAFVRGEDTPAHLNEAAKWLEKAYLMGKKDNRVLLDLTNTYNKLGYYYQAVKADEKDAVTALSKGEGCARRACLNEPQNGRAHFLFAANLFYQKRYQESWMQVKQAQELNYSVPVKFIAALNGQMKDQQ